MARRDWEFQFPADAILDAAVAKREYHDQRLAWWKNEEISATSKLKSDGLTFRDYPVTNGSRVQAVLDPDLERRLDECINKARNHELQRNAFDALIVGLRQTKPNETLKLSTDDIVYFGLANSAEVEEEEED